MALKIYQGDQYAIPITVKRAGQVQTASSIYRLEIILAGMRKLYPGEIMYHEATQKFLFPLNQSDSLALEADSYDALGRAYYMDGTISGWQKLGSISILEMEGAETL